MSLYDRIRELIVQYVQGNIATSGEFREQFIPLFAESSKSDSASYDLAIGVESVYADYLREMISEQELKTTLIQIAPYRAPNPVVLSLGFNAVAAGTNTLQSFDLFPFSFSDKKPMTNIVFTEIMEVA